MGGRAAKAKAARPKLSTTVAAENYDYLNDLVESGTASSLAEALDMVLGRARCAERRHRLEQATAEYFERLPKQAINEENALAVAAHEAASTIDFDGEL